MRLQWTELAKHDLSVICDYTEQHDGAEAGRQLVLRIYDRLSTLSQFPHAGRPGRKRGTRELVFLGLPFLAIYRVREDLVEVIRILHGAQRWP